MTQSPQDASSTPADAEQTGAASSTPDTDAGPGNGEKSIVSKNFSIVGDLTCQDVLHIDGSVEGNIVCQQLTVSEGGRIKGDIRADSVDMRGTLAGAIDARVLTLTKTSNVVGDIVVHESLGIEPGATFDGSCKKLGGAGLTEADDGAGEEDAVGAPDMEAAGPAAPAADARAPDPPNADAGSSDTETPAATAPDEVDTASTAKADTGELPAENMSSVLDKVAAELKATIDRPASAPGAATPLPDPSEPAENFADAMTKPATNGAAAPAAAPAPPPAKSPAPPTPAKPRAAPEPEAEPEAAKPTAGSNGTAPTG